MKGVRIDRRDFDKHTIQKFTNYTVVDFDTEYNGISTSKSSIRWQQMCFTALFICVFTHCANELQT